MKLSWLPRGRFVHYRSDESAESEPSGIRARDETADFLRIGWGTETKR